MQERIFSLGTLPFLTAFLILMFQDRVLFHIEVRQIQGLNFNDDLACTCETILSIIQQRLVQVVSEDSFEASFSQIF